MVLWSVRKSLLVLIGSSLCTVFLFFTGLFFFQKIQHSRLNDRGYQIQAIIQTGPEKEALKTTYLAELLDLSIDRPMNLFALDTSLAEKKLCSSPLIAKAKVKKLFPNTLYIDYEVRKPIARLQDYQNIGVDRDGYLFPLSPFFAPKELPEIYLGLPPFEALADSFGRQGGCWKTPLSNRYFDLALQILHFLDGVMRQTGIRVKRIDVSNAYADSLGQREIVLFTEEEILVEQNAQVTRCVFPKVLRLSTKEYVQQMNNFFILQKNIMEDYRKQIGASQLPVNGVFSPRIIDLRIPRLAFIEN